MKTLYKYTYPVTKQFTQFLIDQKLVQDQEGELRITEPKMERMIGAMHEYLGEAEHGGDIQELYRDMPELQKKWYDLWSKLEEALPDEEYNQIDKEKAEVERQMLETLRAIYHDLILFMVNSDYMK